MVTEYLHQVNLDLRAHGMHVDEPARPRSTVFPPFETELFVNLVVDSGILESIFLC